MSVYTYSDDSGVVFEISHETNDMSVTESG